MLVTDQLRRLLQERLEEVLTHFATGVDDCHSVDLKVVLTREENEADVLALHIGTVETYCNVHGEWFVEEETFRHKVVDTYSPQEVLERGRA
jgi:hypothetical protein